MSKTIVKYLNIPLSCWFLLVFSIIKKSTNGNWSLFQEKLDQIYYRKPSMSSTYFVPKVKHKTNIKKIYVYFMLVIYL